MRRIIAITASVLFVLVAFSAPSPKSCSLIISWTYDFASDPSVTNIVINVGTSSMTYTGIVNCGKSLSTTNSGFAWNTLYYFAGSAQSTNGTESDYGPESSFKTPKKPSAPSLMTIQLGR